MSKSQKVLRTIVIAIILFLGGMCLANASTPPVKKSPETKKKMFSDYKRLIVPLHFLILNEGRVPKTYLC